MGYGYCLSDIVNFDDLANWLESHISESLDQIGVGEEQRPPQMLDIIKDIMRYTLEDEIKEYGWTGDEEINGPRVVNMFHRSFQAYNESLHMNWFQTNFQELEMNNPYNKKSDKEAYKELEKIYKSAGLELTAEENMEYMKRGIQAKLIGVALHLDIIVSQENITTMSVDGDVNKKTKELQKIMDKTNKMYKDAGELMNDISRIV